MATKMLELENIYFSIGNPFPMANMYLFLNLVVMSKSLEGGETYDKLSKSTKFRFEETKKE